MLRLHHAETQIFSWRYVKWTYSTQPVVRATLLLATGIIGTVGTGLVLLAGGNGLFVNGFNNVSNVIAEKDMEIAYLKSRGAAKSDSLELYRYVDERFNRVEQQIAQQAVINTQAAGNLSCIKQSPQYAEWIDQLYTYIKENNDEG